MHAGHYHARYVKMRELMPESGEGRQNPGQDARGMSLAGNYLQLWCRPSRARREGWRCKDRARSGRQSKVLSRKSVTRP